MQRERVLIVDPEPSLLSLLAEVLQEEGYIVQTARDVVHAMQYLQLAVPDVLLIDLFLSSADRCAIFASLCGMADLRPALVFMTTDYRQREVIANTSEGVCLLKPFDLDILLACIRDTVRDRQAQQ